MAQGLCVTKELYTVHQYLLKEVNEDARGNKHLCNCCWGKEWLAGSLLPGMTSTGMAPANSLKHMSTSLQANLPSQAPTQKAATQATFPESGDDRGSMLTCHQLRQDQQNKGQISRTEEKAAANMDSQQRCSMQKKVSATRARVKYEALT